MAITFGKTNEMIKSQFQESTSFFELRIIRIKEDKSLDQNTKDWFIKRYEEKINILKNTYECLDEVINEKRLQGIFVDENSATLKSLNNTSNNKDPFENMSHSTKKLRVAKAFKVLGAILLPVVGTIPFLISLNKAKKKHEAITNILRSENNEIKNFVNTKKRPYDATIGQNIAFSEVDMQNLLKTQSEIQRLQNLLTSSALNPIEKKNLTEKLIALKEYAQNNNYTLSTGILDSAEFKTKLDKKNDNINAFYTKNNTTVTSTAPFANFKDAYDEIVKLDKIKEEANSMLADSSGNQILLDIIKNADSRRNNIISDITTLTNKSTTNLTNTLNKKYTNTSPQTIDEFITLQSDLEKIYKDDFSTTFGSDIEDVVSKLKNLGISTTQLDDFKTQYGTKDGTIKSEIEKLNLKKNIKEAFDFVEEELKKFNSNSAYDINNLDKFNIEDAKDLFYKIQEKFEFLKSHKDSFDKSQTTQFISINITYINTESSLAQQKAKIGYTTNGFKNYQKLAKIDISTLTIVEIETLLQNLNSAKTTIEQENYLQSFLSDGGQKEDFTLLQMDLNTKIVQTTERQQELKETQSKENGLIEQIEKEIKTIDDEYKLNANDLSWIETSENNLSIYINNLKNNFKNNTTASYLMASANLILNKLSTKKAELQQKATDEQTKAQNLDSEIQEIKNKINGHSQSLQDHSNKTSILTEESLNFLKLQLETLKGDVNALQNKYGVDLNYLISTIDYYTSFIQSLLTKKKQSQHIQTILQS